MSKLLRALTITLIGLASLAKAQAANQAPVQDWSIETVVVTAKPQGPALWHVAKGAADVWILGVLGPVPEGLKWDTRGLQQVLSGARQLLLPPRGQVGPFEGIWFLITDGDVLKLPDGRTLDATLPSPLRARFDRVRASIHRDPDRYADYRASIAGFLLEGDYLTANGLSISEPQKTIETLADHTGVPSRRVATYEALQVVKEVPSLSDKGNWACLSDSLDDIDVMAKHARPAAAAWANGDLDGIKANYSDPKALDCLGQSASFNKLWQRSVDDTMTALNAALNARGKTVAVVNIGALLRKNGIVDRLKAEGLNVEGPGD